MYDVAIIGAGILGLANAWMAARRRLSVIVCERSPAAVGATVRNFGMIWPIGQPPGEWYDTARRSRELWLEAARSAGLWLDECGSLHLAYRDDEAQVLREFEQLVVPNLTGEPGASATGVSLLSREEVLQRTQAVEPNGLQCGLWSPWELAVNPRVAAAQLAAWLQRDFDVQFSFDTAIQHVDMPTITATDGRSWSANRVVICSGADLQTLFPEVYASAGLRLCKLQMLRTVSQPVGWKLGPHLAFGLTLRHYAAFRQCPSLPDLCERIARETPELDRYGIHVMASQQDHGGVTLGDSHEFDADVSPFDKAEIDDLMLRELRRWLRLPDWTIADRWHGVYAKPTKNSVFTAEPQPGVQVVTGIGGAGMTLSFGVAERLWDEWTR
jgi:FAD dependent oxidoreductase TIGR03364